MYLIYLYTSPPLPSTRAPNSQPYLLVSAKFLVIFSLSKCYIFSFSSTGRRQRLSDKQTIQKAFALPLGFEKALLLFYRPSYTPYADFATKAERKFIQILTNAAPQWQKFNAGNWYEVETAVRKYAENKADKVFIVTGTGKCSSI